MSPYSVLETLCDQGPHSSMYVLRRGGHIVWGSTTISFTPGGIILSGDLAPGLHNLSQTYDGKSRDWFLGDLSESYLAEKFLHKSWVPSNAADDLRDYLDHREDYGLTDAQIDCIEGLLERLPSDVHQFEFLDALSGEGIWDCTDTPPGWTYRPRDVQLLVEIHKAFRRLYGVEGGDNDDLAG